MSESKDSSTSTSGGGAKYIQMKDMVGFKWMMINILGHDFMHDFLLNTNRTKKGAIIEGKKKVSIIDKVNKTCNCIAKYLKHKNLVQSLTVKNESRGGGMFDNPPDKDIDETANEEKIVGAETKDEESVTVEGVEDLSVIGNPYKEEGDDDFGLIDHSSYDKELNYMEKLLSVYDQTDEQLAENWEGGKDIIKHADDYFQNLYEQISSEDKHEYNPKIIEYLAKGMVSGILSPVISEILNIGARYQLDNNILNGNTIDKMITEEKKDSLFVDETSDGVEEEDEEEEEEKEQEKKTEPDKPINTDSSIINLTNEVNSIVEKFKTLFNATTHNEVQLKISGKALKTHSEILKFSDEDFGTLMDESQSEEQQIETISQLDNLIINGNYSNNSYFKLTKHLLLKNYVLQLNESKGKQTSGVFTIFTKDNDGNSIFDMRPIENTINELKNLLLKKFNIDINAGSVDDTYNIIGKSKNPVKEFKYLLTSLQIRNIDDTFKGNETADKKKKLRNLYYNAMLEIHPDKQGEGKQSEGKQTENNYTYTNHELAQIITSGYQKFQDTMSGGGHIQKGGAIDNNKLFSAMNTLLNKAIIENSLVLMDCVIGNKDKGFFPSIKDDTTLTTPNNILTHSGFRPVFQNIFAGKKLQTYITKNGFVNNPENPEVKWTEIKDKGSKEMKKLIARRILLNVQILILYQKSMPSGITTNSLFESLFLKMDNKKRKDDIMEKRGYLTSNLIGTQKDPNFISKFGVNNMDDYRKKIQIRRNRYFGMLYDSTDIDKIPAWLLLANTEDDMLQNAFNIVLSKLLPETIFEMGKQPNIVDDSIPLKTNIPSVNVGEGNAYVINNAVPLIYPQLKKAADNRFGLLNLSGMQSRNAQFCPVTSIADSQPLCSIKTKASFNETIPRALNYTMDMGLEAPSSAGTYSYYVNMRKVDEDNENDYTFYISGVLTGPDFLIHIGDETTPMDLKLGPLSAVNTFYEILQNISLITKQSLMQIRHAGKFSPRIILRQFFEKNIEFLMKASVKKSIGDYGQEFTALSKYGATTVKEYDSKNKIKGSDKTKTIPYNKQGNALRIMVANDRPSAYRGIFMLLFADENTINTRSIVGYYRKKIEESENSKNSLVFGPHTLDDTDKINPPDKNDNIETTAKDTIIITEAVKKGKLKNVLKIRKGRRSTRGKTKPSSRTINMFLRRHPDMKKWARARGIVLRPGNWRKRVVEYGKEAGISIEGWVTRGGGKRTKKNTRKRRRVVKRKNSRKRRRKPRKKTIKKRKKKKKRKTKRRKSKNN
jgi:hypothetical protein